MLLVAGFLPGKLVKFGNVLAAAPRDLSATLGVGRDCAMPGATMRCHDRALEILKLLFQDRRQMVLEQMFGSGELISLKTDGRCSFSSLQINRLSFPFMPHKQKPSEAVTIVAFCQIAKVIGVHKNWGWFNLPALKQISVVRNFSC